MTLPKHIAIIPDGNRRWAKAKNLQPWDGHLEGVARFWEIAEYASDLGVRNLTFWASSMSNLTKRSKLEVQFLIKQFVKEISSPVLSEKLKSKQIRLEIIGEWKQFLTDTDNQNIEDVISRTREFTQSTLAILFAYDGQREMIDAIEHLNSIGVFQGEDFSKQDSILRSKLWTGILPDVDLVIRTGGEPHWSAGFMMWLTANSQFYFTEELWPDFTQAKLDEALSDYQNRGRRLGA